MQRSVALLLAVAIALWVWTASRDRSKCVLQELGSKPSRAADAGSGGDVEDFEKAARRGSLGLVGTTEAGPRDERGEPVEGIAAGMLAGIAAMTAVSDALLDSPVRPWEANPGIPAGSGGEEDSIRGLVAGYPVGEERLVDIYARTLLNSGLWQIRVAMEECGVAFDPTSDCLLDCYRMVVGLGESIGFIQDMRAMLSRSFEREAVEEELTVLQAEEVGVRRAFHRYFRDRFLGRHGLTDVQVERLLDVLGSMRAPAATVSDLYVPESADR